MLATKAKFEQLGISTFKPDVEFSKISSKVFDGRHHEFAEKFGFYLTGPFIKDGDLKQNKQSSLTNSQIRNFYGELISISTRLSSANDDESLQKLWAAIKSRVLLLRPKLAYLAARNSKNDKRHKIWDFQKVFDLYLQRIDFDSSLGYKDFKELVSFFEAVLAYHKAFGGSDN